MKNLTNTTKQLLLAAVLVVAGLIIPSGAGAQKPLATLSNAGVLQLPTNVALTEGYQFDLSDFGFTSQQQASDFFATKSFTDFVIRPNMTKNKAVVMLDLNKHPGWTVAQWNSLLLSATSLQPLNN